MVGVCPILGGLRDVGERSGDEDHADAIGRVVADLRAEVAVVGEAASPRHRLKAKIAEHQVSSVSDASVQDGHLAWAPGFGVREASATDWVSATTLFRAASISKADRRTAMLRMVEAGPLDLDTPVNGCLTNRWDTVPPMVFSESESSECVSAGKSPPADTRRDTS